MNTSDCDPNPADEFRTAMTDTLNDRIAKFREVVNKRTSKTATIDNTLEYAFDLLADCQKRIEELEKGCLSQDKTKIEELKQENARLTARLAQSCYLDSEGWHHLPKCSNKFNFDMCSCPDISSLPKIINEVRAQLADSEMKRQGLQIKLDGYGGLPELVQIKHIKSWLDRAEALLKDVESKLALAGDALKDYASPHSWEHDSSHLMHRKVWCRGFTALKGYDEQPWKIAKDALAKIAEYFREKEKQ